jgi:hypothetical protein
MEFPVAFRNNNSLVSTATVQNVDANGINDVFFGTDDKADLFIFADGNVGDDTILGFNKNDALVTHKLIFDGNGDGIISLGNEVLDIDRTGFGPKNAGPDQITLTRGDESSITDLRFLGTKEGEKNYVYADAEVRFALEAANGARVVKEGLVSDDASLNASGKDFDFLYDTALGLNLGSDTITGFGTGDRLVTTIRLFDGNNDGVIMFGTNGVLDLAGEGLAGPNVGPGGQIDFVGHSGLKEMGTDNIGGVDYFYYGVLV